MQKKAEPLSTDEILEDLKRRKETIRLMQEACTHDSTSCLICDDCGLAFDSPEDYRIQSMAARSRGVE